MARMADFFERQGNRWNENERVTTEVTDDVALERFQKFRPLIFNGEKDDEVAKNWIETMEKIFRALKYTDERKFAFGNFSWKVRLRNGGE